MDSTQRQTSSSSGKISTITQLDKINAIPNKSTDNVLMDGLCLEDQFFLNALMDDDSSDSDEQDNYHTRRRSAWSPMAQSPIIMKKNRLHKRVRPSYAITLSLEDISYIRPSWGLSKGVKRIEIDKKKKKKRIIELEEGPKKETKIANSENKTGLVRSNWSYNYSLSALFIMVIILTSLTYIVNKNRFNSKIFRDRIRVDSGNKVVELYKLTNNNENLSRIAKLHFGQGIPLDLKHETCACDVFSVEAQKWQAPNGHHETRYQLDPRQTDCIACLDWAMRGNLRIYFKREETNTKDSHHYCYDIKWQSYDTLTTPLIDCIELGEEQWFGLGDVCNPIWPLDKLRFGRTPLITNLSSEFFPSSSATSLETSLDGHLNNKRLAFGSYANFSLFSTNGIRLGGLRTDFQPSVEISTDPKTGTKRLCLSASCTDRCSQRWSRLDRLDEFKYQNNLLEYSVCTASDWKQLISKHYINIRAASPFLTDSKRPVSDGEVNLSGASPTTTLKTQQHSERMIEVESTKPIEANKLPTRSDRLRGDLEGGINISGSNKRVLDGIGLIERTIFATSQESIPTLDGQTLRQYVDGIVKLGLKTSPILLIDSRWQSYVGSMRLNTTAFPKGRLLFEILRNKGYKIVLTIKPYIDASIGIGSINQLLDMGRLYDARYKNEPISSEKRWYEIGSLSSGGDNMEPVEASTKVHQASLIRRRALFSFQNEIVTQEVDDRPLVPYYFRCKESQEGHCVLIDLTKSKNRAWLTETIKRSWLFQESDGIMVGGAHPYGYQWDDHYRAGMGELVKSLYYRENIYAIPQWSGNFGYIQLAPRGCNWNDLRSIVNSVMNLGMMGFSLVHPGSVWGDLRPAGATNESGGQMGDFINNYNSNLNGSPSKLMLDNGGGLGISQHQQPNGEQCDEELVVRWLQVFVFMPILQFNNIRPIEKYGLHELIENLVRVRKTQIVPELKKNLPYTPLIHDFRWFQPSSSNNGMAYLPVIRPVYFAQDSGEIVITEQFTVGSEILVAPILSEAQRQRDIYLPSGFWHDELRQTNLRGGKWLRNYPVELNEIAWFTRAKR